MPESKSGALDQLGESPITGSLFKCYHYTTPADQCRARIRTWASFVAEKIFLIAEKNLMVKLKLLVAHNYY